MQNYMIKIKGTLKREQNILSDVLKLDKLCCAYTFYDTEVYENVHSFINIIPMSVVLMELW